MSSNKTSQPSRKTFAPSAAPSTLQRQPTFGAHQAIQREAAGPTIHEDAPSLVRNVVNSPGRPLDVPTRSYMETRLDHDFSNVRVHTDDAAAESARAVGANAYTTGSHVVFDSGKYSPGTASGQKLMGHELAHVVQQASGPVTGTPVAEGFSISHPQDQFEQAAGKTASQVTGPVNQDPSFSPTPSFPRSGNSQMVVQRFTDTSPDDNYTQQQTQAAKTSAKAGVYSAVFGGFSALGALVSAFEAIRAANFAQRSAEAAEDPPVAEPTTGGVTSTHIELPEVKKTNLSEFSEGPLKGKYKAEDTATTEKTTAMEGMTGSKETISEKKTPTGKGESVTQKSTVQDPTTSEQSKLTEKKVFKEADKSDEERTFTVLRLQEGTDQKDNRLNTADFRLTLRYNNEDVRGGATEDGQIDGYLGGTNQSNASVTFRGSPGAPQNDGTATVRLLYGGTNVPPRKTLTGPTGFFSLAKGGPEVNPNYAVQRFRANARFSAKGLFLGLTKNVSPPEGVAAEPETDSPKLKETDPLLTVSLNPPAPPSPAIRKEIK